MSLRIIYIRQILFTVFVIICSQHDIFSQGTDISTENQPGMFVGLNLGPSQSQIINEGTLSVPKLFSNKKNSYFGSIEVGYYFSNNFGLSSGIGFNSNKTQFILDTYQNTFNTTDSENESYERRVSGYGIKEVHNIDFLSIPFCINLRSPLNETIGFFLQTGVNMVVPISKNYTSSGTFTYKGYYPAYNILLENLPDYGFPSNKSIDTDGELELKPYVFNATASAGFDFFIQKKIQIAVAAIYNKSLSNISEYSSYDKFQLSTDADKINSLMGGSSQVSVQSVGVRLSFRYYFTATHNKSIFSTSESAQSSLAFGSNNSLVSKGGISLYPFLDLNNNGIFDNDEQMVKLTSVRIMGGKPIFSEKDSIVRIPDLNAFDSYIVEFNDNDLENIAWRFKNKIYLVLIEPNQFKHIDIPIIAVGEVSGMTYMNIDNSMKGIGRILVNFYKKNSTKVVAKTLSESDGYIYYKGLEPGEYVACVDSVQLSNLDFTVDPPQIDFTIKTLEEGDIEGGIDFVLNNKKIIDVPKIDTLPHNSIKKDENILVWGNICTQTGNYYIQCGAFKYKNNAMKWAQYIKQNTDIAVGIVLNNGLYKVKVGCVTTRHKADEIKNNLIEKRVYDNMFITVVR
ncbi:MAG: outer membrane beta-barrel protein [Bacteroidetes bacterium]|nr:outer membrane beta-barrel protein [Bacteroidota bacterium]